MFQAENSVWVLGPLQLGRGLQRVMLRSVGSKKDCRKNFAGAWVGLEDGPCGGITHYTVTLTLSAYGIFYSRGSVLPMEWWKWWEQFTCSKRCVRLLKDFVSEGLKCVCSVMPNYHERPQPRRELSTVTRRHFMRPSPHQALGNGWLVTHPSMALSSCVPNNFNIGNIPRRGTWNLYTPTNHPIGTNIVLRLWQVILKPSKNLPDI